jgi:hypothetical protein
MLASLRQHQRPRSVTSRTTHQAATTPPAADLRACGRPLPFPTSPAHICRPAAGRGRPSASTRPSPPPPFPSPILPFPCPLRRLAMKNSGSRPPPAAPLPCGRPPPDTPLPYRLPTCSAPPSASVASSSLSCRRRLAGCGPHDTRSSVGLHGASPARNRPVGPCLGRLRSPWAGTTRSDGE